MLLDVVYTWIALKASLFTFLDTAKTSQIFYLSYPQIGDFLIQYTVHM